MGFKQFIRKNPISAALFTITLGNVVAGIFTYATANQLRPVAQDLLSVHAQILDLKTQLTINEQEHANLVTKSEFNLLDERINHISSRVDAIYNIVATKK